MRAVPAVAFVAFAGVAIRVAAGCATSEEIQTTPPDDTSAADSGGTNTVPDPGSDATTSPETSVDAGADAAVRSCSDDGWCYTELPQEGDYDAAALRPPGNVMFGLRSVWVAPDHRVWAVGATGVDAGNVLVRDANGWRVVAFVDKPLRTVWGSSATDIWIGGEGGFLYRGTVNGDAVDFQKVTIGTTQAIQRIIGTSGTDVWAIADAVTNSGGTLNRIWHSTGETPSFVATNIANTWTASTSKPRIQTLWYNGNDLWAAGYETTCKPSCLQEFIALKRDVSSGVENWVHVPFLTGWAGNYADTITSSVATPEGVQLFAFPGTGAETGNAFLTRMATDPSLLDGGAPVDAGPDATAPSPYTFTNELAHSLGRPNGIFATSQNDIWMVGDSGVIRHFDGTSWNLVRLSLTSVTPLLQDLYDIQIGTDAEGGRELWVVGDDVAIHRKVQP